MIRFFALLGAMSVPAAAEVARIYSGDHDGFTRLVIELPAPSDWTVGRVPSGYAFAARGVSHPEFDLSGVWNRITRSRLAALDTDEETGAVLLTLACECHVFPFEYRPGVVVLDIKPGPPPAGSAFEAKFLAQMRDDASVGVTASEIGGVTYDWLANLSPPIAQYPAKALPLPLATGEVSLESLRNALLEQFARGAADGIVDIGLPIPDPTDGSPSSENLPWSNLRFGESPGLIVAQPDDFIEGARPETICAAEADLDVASWGSRASALDLLSSARTGIYGEFDVPDPEAVLRSVRQHLFLGFGAEAALQASLLGSDPEDETLALYRSMALLVDGDNDPNTPFSTMLGCDGRASLWAALARDRLPPGPGVNRDAIVRSFLALPQHLRGHLGSGLAEKFLALDDADAARAIRDAMKRASHTDPSALALLDAKSDLLVGDGNVAMDRALEAVTLDGDQPEALVALVEAHFRKLEPVSPEVPEALQSVQSETAGTGVSNAVDRAIVLAKALSGQTEAAFLDAGGNEETLADLWHVVHELAGDDDFLRHAVLPVGASPPMLDPDIKLAIARRLLNLGFAASALGWIGRVSPNDAPDRLLVAASAELGRDNARAAVDLLEGISGSEAETLRAEALTQLGEFPDAIAALTVAGQTEAADRVRLWRGHWSDLGPNVPEPWQKAASLLTPEPPAASVGLLGRGANAVEASVKLRNAIEALLDTVALPNGG